MTIQAFETHYHKLSPAQQNAISVDLLAIVAEFTDSCPTTGQIQNAMIILSGRIAPATLDSYADTLLAGR